jgi:hypothetical protein
MTFTVKTDIDLDGHEIANLKVQALASDPADAEARIYWNSVAKELRVHDGTDWVALGSTGGGAVSSVNGSTGAVVLDAADVDALPEDADLDDIDPGSLFKHSIVLDDADDIPDGLPADTIIARKAPA